ncbi:MAG: PH domain-containing protein [Oscillibacter sp.]|nr:PH domain-containing protein [Oscillibacter sp.]
MDSIVYTWKDRKRILGMPITFTRYRLSEDRLFCEKGFFNIKQDEVLLYRVRDLQLNLSLWQRIFGVGTVCVISSDQSAPHMDLINIKRPREVKELIHRSVEEAKDKRRMRTMEVMGSGMAEDSLEDEFDNPFCSED